MAGAVVGTLICYAQDGDQDGDGVFDRRDRCPDTPPNTPVRHNGCPLPTYPDQAPEPAVEAAEPVRVELDVKFDYDKSVVKEESKADIKAVADFMSQYPQTTTTVEGHTDSNGSDAYNQKLSEQRAQTVADYLIGKGLPAGKVNVEGQGENSPVTGDSCTRRANSRADSPKSASLRRTAKPIVASVMFCSRCGQIGLHARP